MRATLALIALAMFGISCTRTGDPDRAIVAMTHIAGFQAALDNFNVDCGRYPSTGEGLAALIARPPTVPEHTWRGP